MILNHHLLMTELDCYTSSSTLLLSSPLALAPTLKSVSWRKGKEKEEENENRQNTIQIEGIRQKVVSITIKHQQADACKTGATTFIIIFLLHFLFHISSLKFYKSYTANLRTCIYKDKQDPVEKTEQRETQAILTERERGGKQN